MYLTDEQIAFRDSVRRMANKEVAAVASEIDREDRFPKELVPLFGDMGLLQLRLPEEYGGPGGGVADGRPERHRAGRAAAALRHRGTAPEVLPGCCQGPHAGLGGDHRA